MCAVRLMLFYLTYRKLLTRYTIKDYYMKFLLYINDITKCINANLRNFVSNDYSRYIHVTLMVESSG